MPDLPPAERGLTPNEFAAAYRIGPDRVRGMILRGQLGAVNVAPPGSRPRYVILPRHVQAWEHEHRAARPAPAPRKRRRRQEVDFFPNY
jgi:hypothetical protein